MKPRRVAPTTNCVTSLIKNKRKETDENLNGNDSAWTPRRARLTRMKVLHCKMEPKAPVRRLKIERSAEAFRVCHDPSIIPLQMKPRRQTRGQPRNKTRGVAKRMGRGPAAGQERSGKSIGSIKFWFSGIWWGRPFFTTEITEPTEEEPFKISVISVYSVVKRVSTPLNPEDPKF